MKKHESLKESQTPVKKQRPESSTKRTDKDSALVVPADFVDKPDVAIDSSNEQSDWETQDPGDLEDVLGSCSESEVDDSARRESKDGSTLDVEIGRVIRKRTQPTLFSGPKPKVSRSNDFENTLVQKETTQLVKSTAEKGTQTEPFLSAYSTKTITTRWENGVKIKTIEKKKLLKLK